VVSDAYSSAPRTYDSAHDAILSRPSAGGLGLTWSHSPKGGHMQPMTPLAYAARELGVGALHGLDKADRDTIKRWAAEEMAVLGIPELGAVAA
jgi:hypothetical protein